MKPYIPSPAERVTKAMSYKIRQTIDEKIIADLKAVMSPDDMKKLMSKKPEIISVPTKRKRGRPKKVKPSNWITDTPASKASANRALTTAITKASNQIRNNTNNQANWIMANPQAYNQIFNAAYNPNMINNPYERELEKWKKTEKIVDGWNDIIKNLYYGFIISNPFKIPDKLPETYAIIFYGAITCYEYVQKENKYGISIEDVQKTINSYPSSSNPKVYHVWLTLNQILDQKGL